MFCLVMSVESENNMTLIETLTDSCDVSTANLQSSSAFFVVPDKDCDIAVETLRTCLVKCLSNLIHLSCTQCQNNIPVYTS